MSAQQSRAGQVSAMAGQIVAHQRAFEGMSAADRQWVIQQPQSALRLMISAIERRSDILPNQTQVAAVKYLISYAKDGCELGKKLYFFLIDNSEGFTKEVYVTLTEGDEFTAEEIREVAREMDAMTSCNCTTHLDAVMKSTGTDFRFNLHYGSYNSDGSFNTDGQIGDSGNARMRYTFWLAPGLYGAETLSLVEVLVLRKDLEKIDLAKTGLYPDLESQVPSYMGKRPTK